MSVVKLAVVLSITVAPVHHHHPCQTHKCKKIHQTTLYDFCNTWSCVKRATVRQRQKEWHYYKRHPYIMPTCTWRNESGTRGSQFALYRYSVMNSTGSGARGKYQMMSGTYHTFAKYHDWSRVDQEIAAHRLYYAKGTGPWQGCH